LKALKDISPAHIVPLLMLAQSDIKLIFRSLARKERNHHLAIFGAVCFQQKTFSLA
jgi:hypothetical protein